MIQVLIWRPAKEFHYVANRKDSESIKKELFQVLNRLQSPIDLTCSTAWGPFTYFKYDYCLEQYNDTMTS
jgi:hypothetical protein